MLIKKNDVESIYSKTIKNFHLILDPILIGPLIILFFYNLNQFALIPYLGLLSENNSYLITASIVGLALTGKSVTEKLSLFGLSVLDINFKRSTVLVLGLVVRSVCMMLINFYVNPISIVASVALIGLAGSMIRPTIRSILNNTSNKLFKEKGFSLMFLFSNLGGIVGPLLVSINSNIWFKNNLLLFLAILDLILASWAYIIFLKAENIEAEILNNKVESKSIFQNISTIYYSNKNLLNIYFLHMFFWIAVSLCIMLVSFLNKISPELSSARGYIFGIEGLVVVFVQILLMNNLWQKRLLNKFFASISVLLLFSGVFLLIYGSDLIVFLIAGIFIGVSEGILGPFIYNSFSKNLVSVDSQKAFSALLLFELLGDMIGYSFSGFILNSTQIDYYYANIFGFLIFGLMIIGVFRVKYES